MNKKLIALIIFSAVFCVLVGCSTGKASYKKQEYVCTWGLFSIHEMDRMRNLLDYNRPFEVLGWSKNGLFAYMYGIKIPERRTSHYSFVIVDTVTNETIESDDVSIYQKSIGIDIYDDVYRSLRFVPLARISEEYKNKWNVLLEKHHIIGNIEEPFSDILQDDLLEFPVDDFSCWFDYRILIPDYRPYHCLGKRKENIDVIKWKLKIGNDNVQKIIGEGGKKPSVVQYMTGSKIRGYYKSPYENRIAVVVSYVDCRTWYETGAVFGHEYKIFGCDMNDI